jgi:ribokinase
LTARIVVLGSLNLDLVVRVSRLPQTGETVLGGRLGNYPGGKGANQAVAAARLGGKAIMVGRVGQDSFGEPLVANLETNGVDASGVGRDPDQPTGAALIIVEEGGQNVIAVAPGANLAVGRAEVEQVERRLHPGDLLVMQLEIPLATVERAVAVGRKAGAAILLNAAPARSLERSLLRQLDVLVVNQREALVLADQQKPAAAARMLRAAGPKLVIVTLGADGCIMSDDAGTRTIEPYRVESVDATGAGDAFVGGLAYGLADLLPPDEAVRLANAAGAAAATAVGAQEALPRPADLLRLFGLNVSSFGRRVS